MSEDEFGHYIKYLEKNQSRIPKNVYDFATDAKHYDLASHDSLHDAWVKQIRINEISEGDRSEIRSIQMEIELVGPYHDRLITLSYSGVIKMNIMSTGDLRYGWGDLLSHKFFYNEHSNCMSHELLLSNGRIEILFGDMGYSFDKTMFDFSNTTAP